MTLLTESAINQAALQIRNAGEETGDIADLFFYGVSGLIFPSLAGAAFDRTGSFTLTLLTVAGLQAASAGAFALVRRPSSRPVLSE